VQIEGLVEGLMHVSETPMPRGEKPQDHFKEGDAVRARILRIEDAEMKVGLSGVGVDAAPEATATADAEAVPVASEAPAATEAPAAEAAPAAVAEPAPKKKRTKKKADEAAHE